VVSVAAYNPKELIANNAAYWADAMGIRVQSGLFTFDEHEYQIEPMTDCSRIKVMKKGTQVGGTEGEVLTNIHGLIHGHYPRGVMYLFPSEADVIDFSKTRIKDLQLNNPLTIGQFVGHTNASDVRRIAESYMYFRYASLTKNVQGLAKQSTRLRSTPVDKVVYEEFDLHEPGSEEQAEGRKGASDIDESVYISNPTVPEFGIDLKFMLGDQRHRWVWCPKCNKHTTCLELHFPDCVIDYGGDVYYGCIKCKGKLNRHKGEWVAHERTNEFPSWWISRFQSFSAAGSAERIIKHYNDPHTDTANFNRMVWGKAYVDAAHRLTPQMVYSCCGADGMISRHPGPTVMGVDVGKVLNVVIGQKINEKARKILWVGRVDSFADLHDLGKCFNVKCCGIDFEPETRKCRDFRDQESYAVYLIDYVERKQNEVKVDEDKGIVTLSRTELCDATHGLIANCLLEIPRRCKEVELFAKQVSSLIKVVDTNAKGFVRSWYVRTGTGDGSQDHYRHALNYFEQACNYVEADYKRDLFKGGNKRDKGVSGGGLLSV